MAISDGKQQFLPTNQQERWVKHQDGSIGMVWSFGVNSVEVDWISGPRRGSRGGVVLADVDNAAIPEVNAALSRGRGMDTSFAINNPLLPIRVREASPTSVSELSPPAGAGPGYWTHDDDRGRYWQPSNPSADPKPDAGSTEEDLEREVMERIRAKDFAGAVGLATAWYTARNFSSQLAQHKAGVLVTRLTGIGKDDVPTPKPTMTKDAFTGALAGGVEKSDYEKLAENYGAAGVFTRHLRDVMPRFNVLPESIQNSYEKSLDPLEATFVLDPKYAFGAEGKSPTFLDLLQSGEQPMSARDAQRRLSEFSNFVPEQSGETAQQRALYRQIGTGGKEQESDAFRYAMGQYLKNLDPILRGPMETGARDFFNERKLRNPELRFIDLLKNLGGSFFER